MWLALDRGGWPGWAPVALELCPSVTHVVRLKPAELEDAAWRSLRPRGDVHTPGARRLPANEDHTSRGFGFPGVWCRCWRLQPLKG